MQSLFCSTNPTNGKKQRDKDKNTQELYIYIYQPTILNIYAAYETQTPQ